MKAKIDQRKKSSVKGDVVSPTVSRSDSRSTEDRQLDFKSDAPALTDKIPSVMLPARSSLEANRNQPQPYIFRAVCLGPTANGLSHLCTGPEYVQYVNDKTALYESFSEYASTTPLEAADASLIQGYTVPGDQGSANLSTIVPEYDWQTTLNCSSTSDMFIHSRPPSACSDHSHSFSDTSMSSLA
jgi:hypothetical protein